MDLISALIRENENPRTIAREARLLLEDPIARLISIDIERIEDRQQLALRQLERAARLSTSDGGLVHAWEHFVELFPNFFERDLITRMEQFFRLIGQATHVVRLRALAELSDPKNWPFDPDLSPEHETNVEAAKAHGVTYDRERRQYVDEDGCPRFDQFGQRL